MTKLGDTHITTPDPYRWGTGVDGNVVWSPSGADTVSYRMKDKKGLDSDDWIEDSTNRHGTVGPGIISIATGALEAIYGFMTDFVNKSFVGHNDFSTSGAPSTYYNKKVIHGRRTSNGGDPETFSYDYVESLNNLVGRTVYEIPDFGSGTDAERYKNIIIWNDVSARWEFCVLTDNVEFTNASGVVETGQTVYVRKCYRNPKTPLGLHVIQRTVGYYGSNSGQTSDGWNLMFQDVNKEMGPFHGMINDGESWANYQLKNSKYHTGDTNPPNPRGPQSESRLGSAMASDGSDKYTGKDSGGPWFTDDNAYGERFSEMFNRFFYIEPINNELYKSGIYNFNTLTIADDMIIHTTEGDADVDNTSFADFSGSTKDKTLIIFATQEITIGNRVVLNGQPHFPEAVNGISTTATEGRTDRNRVKRTSGSNSGGKKAKWRNTVYTVEQARAISQGGSGGNGKGHGRSGRDERGSPGSPKRMSYYQHPGLEATGGTHVDAIDHPVNPDNAAFVEKSGSNEVGWSDPLSIKPKEYASNATWGGEAGKSQGHSGYKGASASSTVSPYSYTDYMTDVARAHTGIETSGLQPTTEPTQIWTEAERSDRYGLGRSDSNNAVAKQTIGDDAIPDRNRNGLVGLSYVGLLKKTFNYTMKTEWPNTLTDQYETELTGDPPQIVKYDRVRKGLDVPVAPGGYGGDGGIDSDSYNNDDERAAGGIGGGSIILIAPKINFPPEIDTDNVRFPRAAMITCEGEGYTPFVSHSSNDSNTFRNQGFNEPFAHPGVVWYGTGLVGFSAPGATNTQGFDKPSREIAPGWNKIGPSEAGMGSKVFGKRLKKTSYGQYYGMAPGHESDSLRGHGGAGGGGGGLGILIYSELTGHPTIRTYGGSGSAPSFYTSNEATTSSHGGYGGTGGEGYFMLGHRPVASGPISWRLEGSYGCKAGTVISCQDQMANHFRSSGLGDFWPNTGPRLENYIKPVDIPVYDGIQGYPTVNVFPEYIAGDRNIGGSYKDRGQYYAPGASTARAAKFDVYTIPLGRFGSNMDSPEFRVTNTEHSALSFGIGSLVDAGQGYSVDASIITINPPSTVTFEVDDESDEPGTVWDVVHNIETIEPLQIVITQVNSIGAIENFQVIGSDPFGKFKYLSTYYNHYATYNNSFYYSSRKYPRWTGTADLPS